ncbi:BgTH12-05967 [Blumeria graminis f. sp. triticale]|uniref:BgTH12-05967 n=1 Tax=Blumeria graminis f. sp. triticale TaxID=1689686 RepID=A0A9W4GG36_BLUGR|nr:BgTH12-05967 [Blumeria graminis f. sp. triticale]
MHCVLLFTIPKALNLFRSTGIVMVTESLTSNYFIFKTRSPDLFPTFREDSKIHRLKTWVYGYDDYITAYCSDVLYTNQLKKTVAKHYDKVNEFSELESTQNQYPETECLKNIQYSQQYMSGENPISITSLVGQSYCSEAQIASLAYRKKVKVIGDFKYFAPLESSAKYYITADRPLEINNVLLGGNFILQTPDERGVSTIGWYHGYLHVFEKSIASDNWRLNTKIGKEQDNGYQIVSSLIGNSQFWELKKHWEILPYGKKNKNQIEGSINNFGNELKHTFRTLVKPILDTEVCSLPLIPAVGIFGSSPNTDW